MPPIDVLDVLENPDAELTDDLHQLNRRRTDALAEVDRQHSADLRDALNRARQRAQDAADEAARTQPRLARERITRTPPTPAAPAVAANGT